MSSRVILLLQRPCNSLISQLLLILRQEITAAAVVLFKIKFKLLHILTDLQIKFYTQEKHYNNYFICSYKSREKTQQWNCIDLETVWIVL